MTAPQQAIFSYSAAAAVTAYGIYIGGDAGGSTATSIKHNLTNDSMAGAGGSLSAARSPSWGVSTNTIGYVGQGYDGAYSAAVAKYTFSTDGVAAGTTLAYGMVNASGAGNGTYMIVGAGNRGGSGGEYVVARVEKYTFSGDTKVDGTSLNQTSDGRSAASDGTRAVFLGGSPDPSNGSKYTFSSDAVATVSNYVGTNRYRAVTAGDGTKGYYMCGNTGSYSALVDVWTFSADTRVAGTTMSNAADTAHSAETSTFAVKAGGYNGGNMSNVEKYLFSGGTVSAMTSLSTARSSGAGLSSAQAHY